MLPSGFRSGRPPWAGRKGRCFLGGHCAMQEGGLGGPGGSPEASWSKQKKEKKAGSSLVGRQAGRAPVQVQAGATRPPFGTWRCAPGSESTACCAWRSCLSDVGRAEIFMAPTFQLPFICAGAGNACSRLSPPPTLVAPLSPPNSGVSPPPKPLQRRCQGDIHAALVLFIGFHHF